MRIYTVYLAPSTRDFVSVKEGFCWPAFLFAVPWALWHRLWLAALAFLGIEILAVLSLWAMGLTPAGGAAVSLGLTVWIGFFANDFRRFSLKRRGFIFDEVVAASNLDAAEQRYLELRPEAL